MASASLPPPAVGFDWRHSGICFFFFLSLPFIQKLSPGGNRNASSKLPDCLPLQVLMMMMPMPSEHIF